MGELGDPKKPETGNKDSSPNEGDILLENLLTHENPNLAEYQKLIGQAKEEHATSHFEEIDGLQYTGSDVHWIREISAKHDKSPAKEVFEFWKEAGY